MAIALSQEELVQQWENFFRDYYKDQIEETALAWPEQRSLIVDYKDIDLRDITLAEHVLENPVAAFVTAERALRMIDVPVEPRPRLRFGVTQLPESAQVPIRNLRAAHLGKLVSVQGLIKKVTEVRPKLEDAAFRCGLCDCVFRHPQRGEQVLEEPEVCPEERGGCGRNARFKVVSEQSTFIDHQKVEIQESPEELKGGAQPERLSVYVEDDKVGQLTPGDRVILNVIMRSQARRQGTLKLTEFAKVGDLVSIQHEQHDFDEVEIDPEDEARILELSQNPHIYEALRRSFSPTIFGLEREKDALILALFGGVAKVYPDGSKTRGDIHVLMVGDPGTAKCLRGDSRITLADGGVTEIRDLVDEAMRGETHEVDDGWWAPLRIPVLSMDGRGRIVPKFTSRAWKRTAPEEVFRIRTKTGRTVEVTPTHPLFMTDGLAIHPREARLLKEGDHIALPRRHPILSSQGDSFEGIPHVESRSRNAVRMKRPKSSDAAFWHFAGLLLGDGGVTYRPERGQWWLEFTNEEPELVSVFETEARRLGLNPGKGPKSGTKALHCWATSVEGSSFLSALGLHGKAPQKKVPEKLFQAPVECQLEFLSGLFDADAHFSKRGVVQFDTASRRLSDGVQQLLDRLGFRSTLRENIVKGRPDPYWRIYVTGDDAARLCGMLRPAHPSKAEMAAQIAARETQRNSNIDVVPIDPQFLRELRIGLGLNQTQMGVPRGTLLGIERGEKHPTRSTFTKIAEHLASAAGEKEGLDPRLREAVVRLVTLSSSDLFWDKVDIIETGAPQEEYVYDLEVPETHNFLANGIVNHNSQLLRYMSKLAPRSIYTSGKSASAAGLCVAPDTLVTLSNGELMEIGPFTESRMTTPETVEDGVWRQWTNSVDVETIGGDLNLRAQALEAVWRLRSPKKLIEVEAQSGRRLTVSAATPLPVQDREEGLRWVKASDLKPGTFLATPRRLPEPPGEIPWMLDLLEESHDCIVAGTEPLMRKIVSILMAKHGSIRETAKHFDVPEESLNHNWVRDDVRGRPSLGVLLRLSDAAGIPRQEVAESIEWYSQRAGHRIRLPSRLTREFLYLVGLIAADGCLWEQKNGGVAIRFSSSDEALMQEYLRLCEMVLGMIPKVTPGSSNRPADARFHSRILADILLRLGVPRSPKSHRIDIPPVLQRLPNDHLASYLRGLYDGDGSCHHHKIGGSSVSLYSTSLSLVRKLQVLFLRFGIQSRLRTRKRRGVKTQKAGSETPITSRHDMQILTITGSGNLNAFRDAIGFTSKRKQANLEAVTSMERHSHSNRDPVPGIGSELRVVREVLGLSRPEAGMSGNLETGVYQPSREHLAKLVDVLQESYDSGRFPGQALLVSDEARQAAFKALREKRTADELAELLGANPGHIAEWTHHTGRRTRLPAKVILRLVSALRENGHGQIATRLVKEADLIGYQAALATLPVRLEMLNRLAECDVHWDPVVKTRPVSRKGDYIYDLTVAGTHNFVANGLLAHNTAAAVRDEFGEGQWTLEAGALVLADGGIACVDELDKMGKEDQSSMHQAMEQQEISVAKAGIQATLRSRCAVIGAANPKMGRFDSYASIHEQINMPPALLSRFDLIFSMKDQPHKEMDEKLASYILSNHRAGEVSMHRKNRPDGQYSIEEERNLFDSITPELEPSFLRKYVAYSKRNIYPVLDVEALELIRDYYVELRNNQGEGIAFTARQLEAFVRLAEASAKVRLSEVATVDDAKRAIGIVEYYLKGVGMDPESGTFDIDMIVTGTSHTQRDRMTTIIHILRELIAESKHNVADRDHVIEKAQGQGVDQEKTESALQQLKAKGQVYEPRPGHYRLT